MASLPPEEMTLPTESAPPGKTNRVSVTLPAKQDDALDRLVAMTGVGKSELIRQAINLLAITKTAEQRGLILALANPDNTILTHIVPSI